MELDQVERPACVTGGGEARVRGVGYRDPALAQGLHLVAVTHPGPEPARYAGEQRRGPIHHERGGSVFGGCRLGDLPAGELGGDLEAIADPEQRLVERVDSGVGQRRLGAVAARRRAG